MLESVNHQQAPDQAQVIVQAHLVHQDHHQAQDIHHLVHLPQQASQP